MDPEANPFTPKKPIDRAMEEIEVLKKDIVEIRKSLEPLIAERNKRLVEEEREEPVVVEKSWWF